MSTLYDIKQKYLAIRNLFEEPDIDQQVIFGTLESVDDEFDTKAENYAKVIADMNADVDAISAEIDRLQERKQAIANGAKKLKQYLQQAMIETERTKFKTSLFSFNIQKGPPSVELLSETLPEQWYVFREPTVDKKGLIEYLKTHGDAEYARLVRTESLRIR